jgi:hypothetical protein
LEMLRKPVLSAAVLAGIVALALAAQVSLVTAKSPNKILTWGTMVGVPAGLVGAASQAPLRGISGGGIPWMLTSGQGELSSNGHLKVEVEGLVLAAGGSAGSNPIGSFRAIVSCVNGDGTFNNILTGAFPATTGPASAGGGDSEIETDVTLPTPCIAPIVFVTSPGGAWFASTGG